ncbi:hypothetical protein ACFS5N_18245 [Mucilaginibacter ximonensis]|uniref:Collagen-like protein n=1 Tax=Mucilaginibacter ximonensis TaxID=538021 RepID=A0ABW5YHC3_9SPHI
MIATACKLDPPIMPGDKGYVSTPENTVPGSKGTTGTTGSTGATGNTDTAKTPPPPFTGFWFCKSDMAEIYNQANQLQSSAAADPFYYSITFDSLANVGAFKLTPSPRPGPSYFAYTIIRDNAGNQYILFDSDPFFRSSNTRIQIFNQTVNTMTWLIIDPKLHNTGSGNTYTAHRLDLIKIP